MIITKEVKIAKEIDDVFVFVRDIISTVKNKEDYMKLVPQLIDAVNGADGISEEIHSIEAIVNTVTLRIYEIVDILITKKIEEEVPEVVTPA